MIIEFRKIINRTIDPRKEDPFVDEVDFDDEDEGYTYFSYSNTLGTVEAFFPFDRLEDIKINHFLRKDGCEDDDSPEFVLVETEDHFHLETVVDMFLRGCYRIGMEDK